MAELVVPVSFIESVTRLLLDHLRDVRGDSIALDVDDCWWVPDDRRYDVLQEPGELTVGQVSEVIDNLRRLQEEPEDAISYGLVWLGQLLEAVGASVVE